MSSDQKIPFNDYKHIPTRSEIDLYLGMLGAVELRRLEERIELLAPRIDWKMHWYDNDGWGYRASFRSRVLCVLHFYHGYYTVTMAIPADNEDRYRSLKDLNSNFIRQFGEFKLSAKTKWLTFRIRKQVDVDQMIMLLEVKVAGLKTAGK
jgi:hypothetical protein